MRFSRLEHLVFYKTRERGMINGRGESKRIAGKYKITNIPVGEFFLQDEAAMLRCQNERKINNNRIADFGIVKHYIFELSSKKR